MEYLGYLSLYFETGFENKRALIIEGSELGSSECFLEAGDVLEHKGCRYILTNRLLKDPDSGLYIHPRPEEIDVYLLMELIKNRKEIKLTRKEVK